MKDVFICGDFNAPHQDLNCTYNTENGEKTPKVKHYNFEYSNSQQVRFKGEKKKNLNQIVRQEYDNSVLYPPVYRKAEELKHSNEVLVPIIQFLQKKLYILQKNSVWT